jgi:hypothetical protein
MDHYFVRILLPMMAVTMDGRVVKSLKAGEERAAQYAIAGTLSCSVQPALGLKGCDLRVQRYSCSKLAPVSEADSQL